MNRICLVLLFIMLLLVPSCEGSDIPDSLTMDDAIQLVADQYYSGDVSNLYVNQLNETAFVVSFQYDGGSGLLQIYGSYLVVDGKITDCLWDETGIYNEYFWEDIRTYECAENY